MMDYKDEPHVQNCDSCANSRPVVTENGYCSVCRIEIDCVADRGDCLAAHCKRSHIKKTFCEHCNGDVEYDIRLIDMYGMVMDSKYRFKGMQAYCKKCGRPAHVKEIADANNEYIMKRYIADHSYKF